jgi:2-methylcitrate dehydratase PrpD
LRYPPGRTTRSRAPDSLAERGAGGPASAEEVVAVHARVPEDAVSLTLEPAAAKRAPRTPYDAKFSLPFAVAARARPQSPAAAA